jgi:hypothetical protein
VRQSRRAQAVAAHFERGLNVRGPTDNETWLIDTGDDITGKRAAESALTPLERLVYCLWVADYGMRNAGDLDTARDLYADFQEEGKRLSAELRLAFTHDTFSQPQDVLQREYFERFERVCDEIKNAQPR